MSTGHFSVRVVAASALAIAMAWRPLPAQAQTGEPEARLARVFQDNMVLQREMPVPIWGWAKPAAQVDVSFDGQKKEVQADEHGYWRAILDPMTANRTPQVLTARIGTTTVSCKNVLVGEVWLSAGHSGTVTAGPNVDTGLYPRQLSPSERVGKPEIRIFFMGYGASLEPYADLDPLIQGGSHWKTMKEGPGPDDENICRSQVEFFAKMIRDRLDVPVGILFSLCVGVVQPTWMSRETLESLPSDNGAANCFQQLLAAQEAWYAKAGGRLKSWADFKQAEDQWRITRKGTGLPGETWSACSLFPAWGTTPDPSAGTLCPEGRAVFRLSDHRHRRGRGDCRHDQAMAQAFRTGFLFRQLRVGKSRSHQRSAAAGAGHHRQPVGRCHL